MNHNNDENAFLGSSGKAFVSLNLCFTIDLVFGRSFKIVHRSQQEFVIGFLEKNDF